MNLNKTFLIGRVTKEVEIQSTQSGKKVAKISLATNQFMGKDKEDKTTFHNIVAWGTTADVAEKYVTKGQEIMIEGHIDNRTYKKKDGSNGYISEVIIENLQLGNKPNGAEPKKKEEEVDDSLPIIEDIPF
jgi:single-strand DNA-binding protein